MRILPNRQGNAHWVGGFTNMKSIVMLLAVLVGLSGQSPAPAQLPLIRHLVYQFGYNTKVATQGSGTGTTTIDVRGPAADGGLMITGTDFWWNTARPRAANTCEVYPNGSVDCAGRPYAISPMQLTIFPLLARGYFKAMSASSTASWTHSFKVIAAIIPGGSTAFASDPYTWNSTFTLHGKGPIAKSAPATDLIQSTGTITQVGGRYFSMKSKQRIAYDPVAKLPAFVSDVRTHFPQTNIYNNDLIELQLIKVSPPTI
jgi:hypothetical protein